MVFYLRVSVYMSYILSFHYFVNFYHSFFIPACGIAQMWMSVVLIKVAVTSSAIIPLGVIIARAKMATSFQQTIIPAMVRLCSTLKLVVE